jgi:hypothetical protein
VPEPTVGVPPELVESLRELVAWVESDLVHDTESPSAVCRFVWLARATIARAEREGAVRH